MGVRYTVQPRGISESQRLEKAWSWPGCVTVHASGTLVEFVLRWLRRPRTSWLSSAIV